jgi:hypothetical protein
LVSVRLESNGSRSSSLRASRRLVAAEADLRLLLRPVLRRPSSALRPAKRPSLCGPAATPAPSFVIRRTGFSFGEGPRQQIQTCSACQEYNKPVSRRCEASRSASRPGIEPRKDGADWPLSVTIKLMSQVIRMILENGEGAVKLLYQKHARQLMGQRHPSEGQDNPGLAPRLVTESVTATDRK